MDSAHTSNRRFTGYTTAELKLALLKHTEGRVIQTKEGLDRIQREIEARESGESKPFATPQVNW